MKRKSFLALAVIALFANNTAGAENKTEEIRQYALKLFDRLNGVPLALSDPRLPQLEEKLRAGLALEAAKIATEADTFYNLTIRHWASPMSNREEQHQVPLNDFIAMVIGVARDEMDARELLSGDFLYRSTQPGLAAPSLANNQHYEQADARGVNLRATLIRTSPQWESLPEAAGLFTTRAWAAAHYVAGTNRRAVEFSFQEFLCRPIKNMFDLSVSDFRVRRDVDRAPGGEAKTYQGVCSGCHGGMDALGGAFARLDFRNNALTYFPAPLVAPKFNQNITVYPSGYTTLDDSWLNLWTANHNAELGWRGPLEGQGIKQFGAMLAQAEGFSDCMTRRAFKEVCMRSPEPTENELIRRISQNFESSGYNLRRLFESVAVSQNCLGGIGE